MYCCLGGPIGAPMVTDDRYLRFGHRQGRLRQKNAEYEAWALGFYLSQTFKLTFLQEISHFLANFACNDPHMHPQ